MDESENIRTKMIEAFTKIQNVPIGLASTLDRLQFSIKNDLHDLYQLTKENPSKAGDVVEKTWKNILETILPINKFRIIQNVIIEFYNGEKSPQIDLVIVKDMPPIANTDYINQRFVIAAFEVKLNLKTSHLPKIFETSKTLSSHQKSEPSKGELHRDIIFGVLAHTSSLSEAKVDDPDYHVSYSEREMSALLNKIADYKWERPIDFVDLFVVAEYFSTSCGRHIYYNPKLQNNFLRDIEISYSRYLSSGGLKLEEIKTNDLAIVNIKNSSIGNLAYNLSQKLTFNSHIDGTYESYFSPYKSIVSQPVYGFDINALSD